MQHTLEKIDTGYRCTVCLWTWQQKPRGRALCPQVVRYMTTGDAMRTATQWAKAKRQPKGNEARSGTYWNGYDYIDLWSEDQTEPIVPLTPQEKAERRAKSKEARTCADCKKTKPRADMYRYQLCNDCLNNRRAAREEARISEQRNLAAQWAADLLKQPANTWAILDTETTDLDGAIVEIAVIDGAGNILLNTRLQPGMPMSRGAQAVHGITDEELKGKPTFVEIYDQLAAALYGRDLIIYNANFDTRRLAYECQRANLPPLIPAGVKSVHCAMEEYAQWWGDWSEYHKSFTWQRLDGGHDALGDCLAVRERLVTMSQSAADSQGERVPEDTRLF